MAETSEWRFSHLGTGSDAVYRADPDFVYLKPARGGPLRRVPIGGLSAEQVRRLTGLAGDEPVPADLVRALFERNQA